MQLAPESDPIFKEDPINLGSKDAIVKLIFQGDSVTLYKGDSEEPLTTVLT